MDHIGKQNEIFFLVPILMLGLAAFTNAMVGSIGSVGGVWARSEAASDNKRTASST